MRRSNDCSAVKCVPGKNTYTSAMMLAIKNNKVAIKDTKWPDMYQLHSKLDWEQPKKMHSILWQRPDGHNATICRIGAAQLLWDNTHNFLGD